MDANTLYEQLLDYFKPWVDSRGVFVFWEPRNPDVCDDPHNTGGFYSVSQNLKKIAERICNPS